jgi:hypothetical protein
MIYSTDKALKIGSMVQSMRDHILKVKKKATVSIIGLMALFMKVDGWKM